ncbi:hypothetical protein HDU85_005322 [Gaertneriomyces sp. JEL0708]|nr:hypothetical protein HDU85_005322 [Gaertneriomyces sp. JEL0708]
MITVGWKGRRLEVRFRNEEEDAERNDEVDPSAWAKYVTLERLLQTCSRMTKVPIENIKLIFGGAAMKDLKSSLWSHGVRNGSKLMMLGDQKSRVDPTRRSRSPRSSAKDTGTATSPTPDGPDSEESLIIHRLDKLVEGARNTILPMVDDYCREGEEFIENVQPAMEIPKRLRDLYAKVSELLLQSLLKVDGVVLPPQGENARLKRRSCVKLIQSELDKIDKLRDRIVAATRNVTSSNI